MKKVNVGGMLLGDGTAKICVPLVAGSEEALLEQLRFLQTLPDYAYDFTEFRADFYSLLFASSDAALLPDYAEVLEQALSLIRGCTADRPVLFTFRTRAEGGERALSQEDYLSLNLAAVAAGADLIDVELTAEERSLPAGGQENGEEGIVADIHRAGGLVIGSSHDFGRTPGKTEMLRRLIRMQDLGCDVTKIAVMPKSRSDVLELLGAAEMMADGIADRPFVCLSMGGLGVASRLAPELCGSAFSFATAGRASAPGQVSAELLARLWGRS